MSGNGVVTGTTSEELALDKFAKQGNSPCIGTVERPEDYLDTVNSACAGHCDLDEECVGFSMIDGARCQLHSEVRMPGLIGDGSCWHHVERADDNSAGTSLTPTAEECEANATLENCPQNGVTMSSTQTVDRENEQSSQTTSSGNNSTVVTEAGIRQENDERSVNGEASACTTDFDCDEGMQCGIGGQCELAPECEMDIDCEDDYVCTDEVCVEPESNTGSDNASANGDNGGSDTALIILGVGFLVIIVIIMIVVIALTRRSRNTSQ